MLRRLYLDNCFTHSDVTFTFENGLTGIIGPNESGKSLIVEMVRYGLFGSKALRGKSEDYKKLHVELDFVVNDELYSVVRKGLKVTLTSNSLEVSGTKPVNEAIRRVLGYDLNVFDVANACNQGNIEALSDMTPTDRKAMVDKTVGLTVLDDLIKFAGQEGNTLKREAEAMSSTLVEPVAPEKPEAYQPSTEIDIAKAQAELAEFNQLRGFLSQAPRTPEEPEACTIQETVGELEIHQENRLNLQRSLKSLEGNLRSVDPEAYSAADLDTWEKQHNLHDLWRQKERLLSQGHHCCPECDHSWPIADLGEFADAQSVELPELTRREITDHRTRIGNGEKIAALEISIQGTTRELDEMPCRAGDLQTAKNHSTLVETYDRQMVAWNTYNEGLAEKQARFDELAGIDEAVEALQTELQLSQQYERDLARYEADSAGYQTQLDKVQEVTLRSKEFLKAREIIQALKVSVKSHLLPSLNKVASMLLSQITGGERYLIEVDEDFEILVDGQRIATLSGSGKAVANLSIRIALGQILTNRVFSLFMADEVDAAMDDDRAAHTAQALRRLTEYVGQVVLVTHKRPETDHIFEFQNLPKPLQTRGLSKKQAIG